MTATATNAPLGQIHALLAERGYEVTQPSPDSLNIRETGSGVGITAVVQGDIVFLSLPCILVPRSSITPEMMERMLDSGNGISTSHFVLYKSTGDKVTIALNNFCKLQDMGADDEDDILSCVHFLLVDVMAARRILSGLVS
jgi:hypothetical protein